MAVADDLDRVSELCKTGAMLTLSALLALGPKPDDPTGALLWEQRSTRLQGQLNSLSALVSKLTAASVLQGLAGLDEELATVGQVSKDAEKKIKQIKNVSTLLKRLAGVLDLGLALLAAAAAPSPATITAVVKAGTAVAKGA